VPVGSSDTATIGAGLPDSQLAGAITLWQLRAAGTIYPVVVKAKREGAKMRNARPILLVEAYRADAVTVERALKDLKVTNQLVDTPDGKKASAYLRTKGGRKPCLILLDLTTPQANGIEFLRTLKAHKALAKIPVIVLATSEKERDVVENLQLGVAGYIVKPVDYKKFVEAVRTVDLCWTLSEPPDEH